MSKRRERKNPSERQRLLVRLTTPTDLSATIAVGGISAITAGKALASVSELELGDQIARFCRGILQKLDAELRRPDTVELKFGLEVGLEGGFVALVKAGAKADIEVKLIWTPKDTDEG